MAYEWLYSDELDAIAKNAVMKTAGDTIGDHSSLMNALMGNGSSSTYDPAFPKAGMMFEGGAKIERTLRVGNLTARGSAKGYGALTTNANRTIDNTEQDFGKYYAVMNLSYDQLDAAQGTEAKVNLVQSRMYEAIANLKDLIGTGLYNYTADGEARGTGSMVGEQVQGMYGLGTLAGAYVGGDLGGDDRIWQGIDSDGADWWDCNVDSTAHAAGDLLDSTSDHYIQKIIHDMIMLCSQNNTSPSMIVTTKTIFGYLRESMIVNQRFTDAKVGALGFETLTFEGIPVFWDSKCRPKHIYVLNNRDDGGEPALAVMGRSSEEHKGLFQMDSEWYSPPNQLIKQRRMWVSLNLWCGNPRLQGSITRVG